MAFHFQSLVLGTVHFLKHRPHIFPLMCITSFLFWFYLKWKVFRLPWVVLHHRHIPWGGSGSGKVWGTSDQWFVLKLNLKIKGLHWTWEFQSVPAVQFCLFLDHTCKAVSDHFKPSWLLPKNLRSYGLLRDPYSPSHSYSSQSTLGRGINGNSTLEIPHRGE